MTMNSQIEQSIGQYMQDLGRRARAASLVRTAFLATADGRLLRPTQADAGDEARGFYRRFASRLRQQPPWALARPAVAVAEKTWPS